MKLRNIIWLLLGVVTWLQANAQFNPTNPPEPTAPPVTYLLTVTGTPEGAASSLTRTGRYEAGTRVSLSASPNSRYVFVGWEDADGNVLSEMSSFSYVMPQHDVALTARFAYSPSNPSEPDAPVEYARLNLSVSPSGTNHSVYGSGKYEVGSSVRVSASDGGSYKFFNWTKDGEEISIHRDFNYIICKGENNLVANYRYTPDSPSEPDVPILGHRLYIKVNPSGAGSVSPASGQMFERGATVKLKASPYSNYAFVSWTTVDGTELSGSPEYEYTVPDAASTLVANFKYSPGNPGEPGTSESRRNVIYGGRISVAPGSEIFYDVNLENVDAVTGINIDISMPRGFIADYSRAIVTSRTQGHTYSIDEVNDSTRRIFIRGTEPVSGGSGAVIRIPVRIPADAEFGVSLTVPLTHGVVVNPDGTQTAVGAIDGIIKIADALIAPDSPDFVITDVRTPNVSVMPGDALSVEWKVANRGSLAATGGWSEVISLVSSDNRRLTLSTVYYDTAGLGVGEEVPRTATVGIPEMPGFDGELDVRIDLTPFVTSGEIDEYQLNNTAQTSGSPVSLGKLLILDTQEIIPEDYKGALKCTLRRTGSWSDSETFTIKKISGDDRLEVPREVTIRRDQSEAVFLLYVHDNAVVDETPVTTIEVSGNGYDPVSADITIEDNDFAAFVLEVSADDITEGEAFDLTVTAPKPVTGPVTFNIVSDHPSRFRHPSQATIEAGGTSTTVKISSVDDDEVQLTEPVEFTVSAANYEKSFVVIEIHDNDMPEMELSFTPAEVSESAGPTAVMATLTRKSNADKKVTVRLSDNSKSNDIYYPYSSLTMERGVESIEFPLGVNNNTTVDGDREVEITAAVYVQACSCSPTGTNAGLVTRTLSIIDDDGPSLNLRSSGTSLIEGNPDGIILTVTRNTDPSDVCTVRLSSDYDEGLTFPKEVVMAKGETFAEVRVVAVANDISDDSRTISFAAESEGYSKGLCWVVLTDRTLPDAVITGISLSKDEVEVGEKVTLTVTLRNDGVASLSDATKVSVYSDDATEPFAALYTSTSLSPGNSMDVAKSITLPAVTGEHRIYAVVNDGKTEKELIYTNNTSKKVGVNVLPPFRASIATDKAVYSRGEQISFTGKVSGKVEAGDEVEVYVINESLRLTVSANVDASGNFKAVFTPYSIQIGHFTVGACYPGEGLDEEMASFDVMGIRLQSKLPITHQTIVDTNVKGNILLSNPASVALSGVKAVVVSKPDNIDISLDCPSSIEAGKTADLQYSVKGTAPSVVGEWDVIKLKVESGEGASCNVTIRFYCRNAQGKLVADIEEIRTSMTVGQPREYSFSITNVGNGPTGAITLSLPEWMKSVTPRQMPSLSADESANIVLQFTSSDKMQLNVPVTGQIGVNCENGEGFPLKYVVEPVSDATGTLVVDVCDEYTYYTEAAPHVEGAEVAVMHPVSKAVLATGVTDSKGIYSIELPEGYYALKVTCPRHESYLGKILVDPGRTTTKVIDLSVSGVQVTYSVEETEVEDEYTVVTNYTYSTEVPVPVVVTTQDREVNGQDLAVGESVIVNIIVTNEGLITALDFQFGEPVCSEEWAMTFLGDMGPFDLPAKQSYTIPLKVTRLADSGNQKIVNKIARSESNGSLNSKISPCMGGFEEYYKHKCGKTYKESKVFYVEALQICAHSGALNDLMTAIGSLYGGEGRGDVFITSGGYSSSSSSEYYYSEDCSDPIDKEPLICDDDAVECADKIVKNLVGMVPGLGKFVSAAGDYGEEKAKEKADNDFPDEGSTGGNGSDTGGKKPSFSAKATMIMLGGIVKDAVLDHVDPTGLVGPALSGINMLQGCWKYIKKKTTASRVISHSVSEYSETDKVEAYLRQLEIIPEIFLELYGAEEWYMDDIEGSIEFFDYAASLDEESITFENLLPYKPAHISSDRLAALLERVGERNPENSVDWDHFIALTRELSRIERDAHDMGYESSADMYEKTLKEVYDDLSDPEGSVCSKVKLQISQSVVMTRQAFRGTLSVSNGSAEAPLTDFQLILDIRDRDGNVATSHEFQTSLEKLDGFNGDATLDGPWSLNPKHDGVAQILFIPTRYAAETEPQDYTFSGVIRYTDPYTGLYVTRSLSSTTLTVKPSPVLDLTYFMQRDVYGDDPFTPDVVEPSIPGEFALVIDNVGYGDANNVRISTQQPQIIENEKGLFVDFELIGSQLNGEDFNLSFGKTITSDFGTIPAQSSAYAQWWLKCNLAGFFDDYDVKVNHVTSYGNEDMSLLNEAAIHELVHGFSIANSSGAMTRGFLVNDVMDSAYLPDIVYFSDGADAQDVSVSGNISIEADGENEYVVTVNPASEGWTYGNVADPTGGKQTLVSVARLRDGAIIPVDNFWQTPYVLRKNAKPLHEHRLNAVANQTGVESYRLVFAPRPDLELAVEAFVGIPDNGGVLKQPLKTVDVTFNKGIDPTTFTGEDITLYNQGRKLDTSGVGISNVGGRTYRINLEGLTSESGLYVLTVNTDGIRDADGFAGVDGSTVTWIQDINTGISATEVGKVSIYPLPMRQNVYVSGNYDKIETIEFYDSNGILRLKGRNISQYQPLDVSMLSPDVYIVRVSTDAGTHIVKATKR